MLKYKIISFSNVWSMIFHELYRNKYFGVFVHIKPVFVLCCRAVDYPTAQPLERLNNLLEIGKDAFWE